MIVNYRADGWQVITQRSHGILAAQLAFHWAATSQPTRWVETILAIAEHDDAENELDGENLLTETGGPLNFDMKNFELAHCQKLSSLTFTKSRYVALLTSMHMEFLYRKDASTDQQAKTFLDQARKLQASWRKELGISIEEAERLYHFLEWCDALSLLICKGEMPPESRMVDISVGPDGSKNKLVQLDENTLTVVPWPFQAPKFEVSYEWRLLSQLRFSSSAEFRKMFLAASVNETRWTLRKTSRTWKNA